MTRILILGAGSWGTAIARLLALNGSVVTIWDKFSEHLAAVAKSRENEKFLPGIKLPNSIIYESELSAAINANEILVFAIPTQFIRSILQNINAETLLSKTIVNLAKGIETSTLKRISEIFIEFAGSGIMNNYCALTGPSHSEEVSLMKPTSIIAASVSGDCAKCIQNLFNNNYFRVYTNNDLTGAEIGGAVKNIIAIAAGVCDGLALGDNARAALITRGLAEITRLGVAFGANERTFAGLSGLGDLVVTCGSKHSRNYNCGLLLAKGEKIQTIQSIIKQTIEGVETVKSVYSLSQKCNITMPISEQVYYLISGITGAAESVKKLMERLAKPEFY